MNEEYSSDEWEFFIGLDVGRRIDASAIVIIGRNIKTEERRVLFCKEGFRWEYFTTIKYVKDLVKKLGDIVKIIAVDSTGMGDPVYEALAFQETGGEPLRDKVMAVKFTVESKEKMMAWLTQLLQQGKLKINPIFKRLLIQMRLQKAEVKGGRVHYSHPSGGSESEGFSYHDDLLWAMNLALWADYNYPIGFDKKGVIILTEKEEKKENKSIFNRLRERFK